MNKSSNVQKIVVKEDVCEINLTDIHPFKDHPFKVLDDDRMLDTVESIREYGVLVPVIVRPRKEGGYVTTSKAEVEEYLGFDILVPSLLAGKYNCESYEVNILPIWIQCMCNYAYGDQTISIMIYFLTDVNDTVLFMEQNEVGDIIHVDDLKVYVSENVDNNSLIWSDNNIVFHVMGQFEINQGIEIVKQIGWR